MPATPPRAVLPWTLAICALVTAASVLGLVEPSTYAKETENWAAQARGQDAGNLLAVATLLLSSHGYRRGSLPAALVWSGTLMYLVYAYVVYAMAVHFGHLFLVYVAVLGLSCYAIMWSIDRLRADVRLLPPSSARRSAGCTLVAIGVLFTLLWLGELVPATLSGETPRSVREAGLWVNPIHVIDLAVLLPAFVIAGTHAMRGRGSGLFFVGPLLVFSVLMGTSIVAAMVLMTSEGFDNTVPPLVMVSVVVLASILAAQRYLASLTRDMHPHDGVAQGS